MWRLRAWGDVSLRTREALGSRPGPLRGSATCWLDAVRVKAGESLPDDGQWPVPSTRKRGPRDRNRRGSALTGAAVRREADRVPLAPP